MNNLKPVKKYAKSSCQKLLKIAVTSQSLHKHLYIEKSFIIHINLLLDRKSLDAVDHFWGNIELRLLSLISSTDDNSLLVQKGGNRTE